MLFSYTYVPHKMEKMQRFINFIFYQVWCRARKAGPYDLALFNANPPLQAIMTSLAYDHTKAGDLFSSQVQAIYQSFAQLSRQEVAQFKRWYQGNNDVEKVCAKDPAIQIARYNEVAVAHKVLAERLAKFFKGLYSDPALRLAVMSAEIGDIDDHYQAFVKANNVGKCPFCGMNDLLGEYNSRREAYDHYLPKALYPFNSINFRNLVPCCHHCNSSYKTSKDPSFPAKDPALTTRRRAVFYPYKPLAQSIQIIVTVQHADLARLVPEDISLQFGPAALSEEIDTWRDVYGIDERYKAKVCSDTDGKYWLTQVLDECQCYGVQPADILATRAEQAVKSPYADCNFLRAPFLEACREVGLL